MNATTRTCERPLSLATGALALGLGLAACNSDTTKAPGYVLADPLPAEAYPKISLLEGLQGFVVMSTSPRVDEGPPMKVTAQLRAKTDYQNLAVQYRYFFFDKNASPINANPDWQYVLMPSRVETFMIGQALDRTAADWRLEIRPAK